MHTVVAADANGVPIRVACGYCSSEHNFRGGPRMEVAGAREPEREPRQVAPRAPRTERHPFPLVSERERIAPPMTIPAGTSDFEMLLRRIIREETGLTAVAPAERWRGGTLVLKPGNASQDKTWPIETFFHKI